MRLVDFRPGDDPKTLLGAIATHEVRFDAGARLRKGQAIGADDLRVVADSAVAIHAVVLESGDVHEDVAAKRLAAIVSGPHIQARSPVQSRVNLVAGRKGLLRVNGGVVRRLNELAPVGVFTLLDRVPVVPGRIVAGAKIATVSIPEAVLERAGEIVSAAPGPVLQVKPFVPHRVGVVVTDMAAGRVRDRFEGSVLQKMAWYGSTVIRFDYVPADVAAVSATIERLVDDGANLLLVAGGNMMDPLDPTLLAMPEVGAELTRLGAPAHPGSMFWLGEVPAIGLPIVNLASCSMYSRATVADLVLPLVMAGEQVTADDIADLGYGGLLDRTMNWRFPDYQSDSVEEPDEE